MHFVVRRLAFNAIASLAPSLPAHYHRTPSRRRPSDMFRMVLPEDFELVVNPPQTRWNEIVNQINAELGWKMSYHDYRTFREGFGDQFFFLVAIDKRTNRFAACIGGNIFPTHNAGPDLFTIGLYYTRPDYRQDGLGRQLFAELIAIGNGRNMFLNSAPVMSKKYATRSGFDKISSWELVCFVAQARDCYPTKLTVYPDLKIVDLEKVDFDKVEEFDRNIGAKISRRKFIEKWLTQRDAYNKFAVDENGTVLGYCNARVVYGGHVMIGPLYADCPKIAESLLKRTLEAVPAFSSRGQVVAYLCSENVKGQKMFKKMVNGEVNTDRCMPRQFSGEIIETCCRRVYAITETDFSLV